MTMRSAREKEWANMMRSAIAGDGRAYHAFLMAITPYLRAIARKRFEQYGASASEAEDVVQEVLLTIHLKRASWDATRPIGPWISTIVRHKLVDSLRKRGRHVNVPIDDVIETLETEERVSTSDRMDVEQVLTRLNDPQRTIVRSISVEGTSVRETADRLRMTEGAVRVALHRALKVLAGLYRNELHENR